jgi:hypothetical protein
MDLYSQINVRYHFSIHWTLLSRFINGVYRLIYISKLLVIIEMPDQAITCSKRKERSFKSQRPVFTARSGPIKSYRVKRSQDSQPQLSSFIHSLMAYYFLNTTLITWYSLSSFGCYYLFRRGDVKLSLST